VVYACVVECGQSVAAGTAAKQQLTRTFLQVEEGNAAALALYRRAGFTPPGDTFTGAALEWA
jgi:RimJ/RimL family protein N-acetyltransferase